MGNKEKAIELVKERDIKECLQWIMDNRYKLEVVEMKEAGGKTYKGKKLTKPVCLILMGTTINCIT